MHDWRRATKTRWRGRGTFHKNENIEILLLRQQGIVLCSNVSDNGSSVKSARRRRRRPENSLRFSRRKHRLEEAKPFEVDRLEDEEEDDDDDDGDVGSAATENQIDFGETPPPQ